MTKPQVPTYNEMETALKTSRELCQTLREGEQNERQLRRDAETREKETRALFSDLKEKLAAAVKENSRLLGYLQRVHEEDVVREELIATEDPQSPRLVPKRKFAPIGHLSDTFNPPSRDIGGMAYHNFEEPTRAKSKNWVNY